MSSAKARRIRAYALITFGCIVLCNCTGGISCDSCAPTDYSYPSQLAQGVEPVDDGMRARLTERGLDFIVGHLDLILAQTFPPLSSDPDSPDSRRAAIPFSQFGTLAWGDTGTLIDFFEWEVELSLSDEDPTSYAYVILEDEDGETLRDKITADFIEPSSIRLHVEDLRIGIDATALGIATMEFANEDLGIAACLLNEGFEWVCPLCAAADFPDPPEDILTCSSSGTYEPGCCQGLNRLTDIDIGCKLIDGNRAALPYPGHAISLSFDIVLRPSVTNVGCENNAPSCIIMDTVFDPMSGVEITDVAINVVNSDYDDLCTDDDAVFGDLLSIDHTMECDAICPVLDGFMGVIENVVDLLGPLLDVAAGAIIEALLESIFDSVNGKPLEYQNRVALGDLAGGSIESLNAANDMGFLIRPTTGTFRVNCPPGSNSCDERRGMDMVLSSGFESVHDEEAGKPTPNPCVEVFRGVDFVRHYGGPAFEAPDSLPLTGEYTPPATGTAEVYDIAGSLALAALNQAGFAAYNSGLLCLMADSEEIHYLTNGAFSLTAGTVDLLSGGDLGQFTDSHAPALVAMAPEKPPTFTYGEGTDTDPMLHVEIERLHISMYVMVYERMVRMFEVVADAKAGLTVTTDPNTKVLQFQLVEGPDISNFEETYNELLPYSDFRELLPALLEILFGSLLADNIEFSYDITPVLEQALGIPIYMTVDGIETVGTGGGLDFLNVYLGLSDVNPNPGGPLGYRVISDLQIADDPGLMQRNEYGEMVPSGLLRLQGRLVDIDEREEYCYRVDGGMWRTFVRADADGILNLKSPLLGVPGQHRVEVRGRRIGAPETLETEPQELLVHFDPESPLLRVYQSEDGDIIAVGSDRVTPTERLQYAFALDDQEFDSFSPRAQLDAEDLEDAVVVSARARDEAGNLSPVAKVTLHQERRQDQNAGGCSCASSQPGVGWWFVVLGLVILNRRRFR